MTMMTTWKMKRTKLTNSNSETQTANTVTFTTTNTITTADTFELEVEVDQENMIKALRALTDAGVLFKLKKVAPTPKYSVSIPSVWIGPTPTNPYTPTPYQPVTPWYPNTHPWINPTTPFYYEVACGAGNTTGCTTGVVPGPNGSIVTSTCCGYPPGTQSSCTGGVSGRSNCSCDDCTDCNNWVEDDDVCSGCGGNYDSR